MVAVLVGCAPTVLWSGHTTDRHVRIDVVEDGGLQYVVVNGRRHAAYRGVAGWSIATADPDHVAFAAELAGKWVVVHDGHTSEKWDAIGAIVLSRTGRLAYAAERSGGWHVVVEGKASARYDAIVAGTLQFSADGRHVAFINEIAGRSQCVVDGIADPYFDGIGSFFFGDDGHYAYAARNGDDAFVVHDRSIGRAHTRVTQLVVAGAHHAYAVWDETAWRVVVDGQPGAAVDRVRRILFSSDGAQVAWVGRIGETDVLSLDGVPIAGGPRIREDALAFSSTGIVAYVRPTATGREEVVVGDKAGPSFDAVGVPVWSSTGNLAYAATRSGATMLVVDDRVIEVKGTIEAKPIFSPKGDRLAYVVRRGKASFLVVDGRETEFDFTFADTLAFSTDSSRWAVIGGDLKKEQLFFAIEGRGRVRLETREIYSAAAQQPDDPARLLRDWTTAEANRASAPR
jgi:hypothetical protein